MSTCCRCKSKGDCNGCRCRSAGRECKNCLPSYTGGCSNQVKETTQDVHVAPCTPLTLPMYRSMDTGNCSWNNLTGDEFSRAIQTAYTQIVHWKHNLFQVPSGTYGKEFVCELARLFTEYANESTLEAFLIKAAMSMPALALQKPHAKSKTREHITCLARRLELWRKGDIAELRKEGKVIQDALTTSSKKNNREKDDWTARRCAKLMMEGNLRGSLRLLTSSTQKGPLKLDQTIDEVAQGSSKTVKDALRDLAAPGFTAWKRPPSNTVREYKRRSN